MSGPGPEALRAVCEGTAAAVTAYSGASGGKLAAVFLCATANAKAAAGTLGGLL